MKTHTIKTPTAELLIVELQTEVINSSYHIQKTPKGILIKDDTGEKFISNKYTLLGKPDEISEEDARELVGEGFDISVNKKVFNDYKDDCNCYKTAKESLLSLLETEIYWDNPLGTKRNVEKIASFKSEIAGKHLITLWHEAEQKTFNRNQSIIFKKVTPKI